MGSLALLVAGLALGAAAWASSHQDGARLWVRPRLVVLGVGMNPRSELFRDNVALAKAVNYALDRPALVRAWGPLGGRVTARLVPPGMPGFGARAPYPLNGPNLPRASALAKGNMRSGKAVMTLAWGEPFLGAAKEVRQDLAEIGLEVTLVPNRIPCGVIVACDQEPDLYFAAWAPDFPDEKSIFDTFTSPVYETPLSSSPWKERLSRASHAAGKERGRAFAQLDYDVMREAPFVAPFIVLNARGYVSARTHCIRWNPYYGVDLGALCVS